MSEFLDLLQIEIPRLRRYARVLHRANVSGSDDLLQDTLVRALVKQHLWVPGTNLRAWLFTLMHNQHVNDVRYVARQGVSVDPDTLQNPLVSVSDPSVSLLIRD